MEAAPDKKNALRDGMARYAKAIDRFWSGEAAHGELPDEAALLKGRRWAMGQPATGRFEALALSGGGIRSATFALGVLQALAGTARDPAASGASAKPASFKDSLLSRFDYLSTVSGGGFIGAFLVGLFVPGRLRKEASSAEKAANDAQAVLGSGPPGRIKAAACKDEHLRLRAPLAWLRENGRYLTPTGTGDLVYAAGLGLRNWVSLHVVIGVALLLALTLMAVLRSALLDQPWAEALCRLEARWLNEALAGARFSKAPGDSVWWSTLFVAALVPLVLWVVPMGVAFWTTSRTPDGDSKPINRSSASMAAAAGVFVALGYCGAGGSPLLQWIWWGVAGVTALGVLAHVVLACFEPTARMQSVQLTRWLASGLIAAGVLVLLGIIETLGHTLYLLTVTGPAWLPSVPAALGAALAWLGKKIGASGSAPGWMQKLPLTTLGGMAGLAALLLIATLWAWVVQWLAWQGEAPGMAEMVSREHLVLLLTHAAAWLLLAVGVGQFPAFINLSSLQSFYAARLIRTYLGASNGERFVGDASRLSAAEPMAGDNLRFETLYQPARDGAKARLTTWAPLHLVNVTVNKTVDPAEQLVQRDRKGQPMAVMPYGFAIDGWRNLFKPVGGFAPPNPPMHLGEWVGTSGAAFSTGIGRETTLGMSLLMGAANVRLGVWWASGQDHKEPLTWHNRLGRWMGAMFRTQTYLSYEFTARFYGLRRRWQYLSDGGHFENTALYELLRRERNVGFIVASDNGADPTYRFDDLANLIRLARIDLRMDVSVVSDFGGWEHLPKVFGSTVRFSATGGETNPAALLLKAQSLDDAKAAPSWIVLLKPSPQAGAPADVLQYAKTHPAFPQEPTSDQFFDEAQWESYRSLGEYIAARALAPAVWAELQQFMAGGPPPAVSPPP